MVHIQVLGSGCANCKRVEQIIRKVVANLEIQAEIEKVTDQATIMQWPLLATPGLVINGKLVSSGKIPREDEIIKWLEAA